MPDEMIDGHLILVGARIKFRNEVDGTGLRTILHEYTRWLRLFARVFAGFRVRFRAFTGYTGRSCLTAAFVVHDG